MSDHPSDLEFKLQHIVIAVKDVGEWYDLGLQLGLPDSSLAAITSHPDVKGHKRLMLSEWLKYDTEASWDKLAGALSVIGENVVSANIRSRFMKAATSTATPGPVTDASNEDDKTCQEMTETVLQKIKGQFASLQVEVRSAMEKCQVKLNDVHQFLVSFFQSESCIPEAPNLTKLFNTVTEAKLWRYNHYSPLKELAEKFLPADNPARKLVSDYKNQLSGFYTTTRIIDFIDLSELDSSESDSDGDSEDGARQSLTPKEYKKFYRELKVTLKLDRKIKLSEVTMNYVDTLWKVLVEEFNLPPLSTIIKKIVPGSLIIIWLVPPQVSTAITASYSKAVRFYQQHNIAQVQLDGSILYIEEWNGEDSINSALIETCKDGHIETARVLLDQGAEVNYQDEDGKSILWWTSFVGDTECVKMLLKHGAQVDLSDASGNTPLIKVCLEGYTETARVLLDHGASIDHQNNDGETALNEACYMGKSEAVHLLLKAGAQTNIQDKYGGTGLFWATWCGHVNIVQMMVDHGATVDLGRYNNLNGETALHHAALYGHVEVTKTLVKYGAAVDIRNKEGLTALDVARGHGYQDVYTVLEHYTKQKTTELSEDQRESIYQRLLKMLERTFLKEQAKKREEQQQKERHNQGEERGQGKSRDKRSFWSHLRGHRNRPEQITGTAPASEK